MKCHHLGVQSIFLSCFVIIICICEFVLPASFSLSCLFIFLFCLATSQTTSSICFIRLQKAVEKAAISSTHTRSLTRLYLYIVGLHKCNVFCFNRNLYACVDWIRFTNCTFSQFKLVLLQSIQQTEWRWKKNVKYNIKSHFFAGRNISRATQKIKRSKNYKRMSKRAGVDGT